MLCSKKSLYNMHLSLIYMNLQSLSELQISSALSRTLSNSNIVSKQKATLKWKASFNWQLQLLLMGNGSFLLNPQRFTLKRNTNRIWSCFLPITRNANPTRIKYAETPPEWGGTFNLTQTFQELLLLRNTYVVIVVSCSLIFFFYSFQL